MVAELMFAPLAHIAGAPVDETFAFLGPTAVVVLGVTSRERWGQLLRAHRARVQKIEPRLSCAVGSSFGASDAAQPRNRGGGT